MGSKIAFWPVCSASFALHMDCLPTCNQNLLNVIGQYFSDYTDYKWKPQRFRYQNLIPLPTYSAFICKYLFIKITCQQAAAFSCHQGDATSVNTTTLASLTTQTL